jgi:hypothetical protein
MSLIHPKGSPSAPVWVIVNKPLAGDTAKGYIYSSGMGYVFDKMMQDAGIPDYYVTARLPDLANGSTGGDWESRLAQYKPPIIIPLDSAGRWVVEELTPKHMKKGFNFDTDSAISKYAGSILTSDKLSWPHYVVPTYGPQDVIKQWKMRDIVVSCDLAKAASELDYYNKHGRTLEPLPAIDAKIDFDTFDELLWELDQMLNAKWISNDIETIYPKKPTKTSPSQFYKILPGYPITIGLAVSTTRGLSFNLFRDSTVETRELWKKLAKLLKEVPSVGQNFFNFDANFYEMLGFQLPLEKCRDTMILHHLLWAELPHKLQFLARQYTRHKYWKDEGAGWSIKNMRAMKIYNVKDVCVTLEIFHKEMEEILERGLD